jgi:hypothetical protein
MPDQDADADITIERTRNKIICSANRTQTVPRERCRWLTQIPTGLRVTLAAAASVANQEFRR